MGEPDRFLEQRQRDLYWLVTRAWAEPLARLGWPSGPATESALVAPASVGRSATAVLEVPTRRERVHLRPVRHGGLLGSLWKGLLWGHGRPAAELRATARLAARGAPVPEAVMVLAHRRLGPLWSATVGTRYEEGARDALDWLGSSPAPEALRRAERAAGRAIRRFHDAGGAHADLHLKNLLVRERAEVTEVIVIDLDRAQAGAPPEARRRMRELMRLYRSLVKRGLAERVGARGCAAALSAYCAGDRRLRRALLEHLPAERRRLARHARVYRTPG